MVVAVLSETSAGLSLLVVQHSEYAEYHGDPAVEANAHESLGDCVGDVLEVHGLALDQNADGDHGIKGARSSGVGGGRWEGGQVRGRGAEEVASRERGGAAASRGLDLRGGEEPLRGVRGLETATSEATWWKAFVRQPQRELPQELRDLPLDRERQFPRTWDGLYDDIRLLDAASKELSTGAPEERFDYGGIPAGVDDRDTEG